MKYYRRAIQLRDGGGSQTGGALLADGMPKGVRTLVEELEERLACAWLQGRGCPGEIPWTSTMFLLIRVDGLLHPAYGVADRRANDGHLPSRHRGVDG